MKGQSKGASRRKGGQPKSERKQARLKHAMACIDTTPASRKVIPHAAAIASAIGAHLSIVHVIEAPDGGAVPFDPVTWELRRREAKAEVEEVAAANTVEGQTVETRILEGHSAAQIASLARDSAADLTCMCTHGDGEAVEGVLGETARGVIAAATGSVLLVPSSVPVPANGAVTYTRVFVPLDGSARAETVLSVAVNVAHAHGAELVLGHATPEPQLTRTGPFEAEDEELATHVRRRNERVAREYLERVRTHITAQDISVRVLVLRDGDVRRALARAVGDEAADLVVMASHGHSGHTDVASGDVAAYLMGHVKVPLVIVRSQATRRPARLDHAATGVRLPDRAQQ